MFKFKMILQKRIFGKRYDDSSKKIYFSGVHMDRVEIPIKNMLYHLRRVVVQAQHQGRFFTWRPCRRTEPAQHWARRRLAATPPPPARAGSLPGPPGARGAKGRSRGRCRWRWSEAKKNVRILFYLQDEKIFKVAVGHVLSTVLFLLLYTWFSTVRRRRQWPRPVSCHRRRGRRRRPPRSRR